MTGEAMHAESGANPRVTVVVVNWNRKADTLACLDSLSNLSYPNLNILVVDNASEDGSPQAIAEAFPEIEQIRNAQNVRFAGGTNTGIRQALNSGTDLVLILNNDTTIAPDALNILVEHLSPRTGILAPLIYYFDDPQRIWSAGGKTSHWNLEKIDSFQNKPDPGEWPAILQQDFVTGCAMLLPRSTLESVGLFDEKFAMYYEDSDLCRRVRQAGMEIAVVPQAKVWHKVAASSGGSDSPLERYWMARSSIRFFRKHARGIQPVVILFWRSASAFRTSLRLTAGGKWSALKAYWRGLWHGLTEEVITRS